MNDQNAPGKLEQEPQDKKAGRGTLAGSLDADTLKAARIEDYAVLGDCETAALVSREGSIDWLCWPSFASPACFAALLGTGENGYWSLRPKDAITSTSRCYRAGTMILETTISTASGEVCLTDFMPPRGKHSDIIRMVKGVRGEVAMRMELALRFDYGLTIPWVTSYKNELRAIAGPNMAVLRTVCAEGEPLKLHGEDHHSTIEFTVREGQTQCFVLTYAGSNEDVPEPVNLENELADTEQYWCEWSGRSAYRGDYADAVQRSLMTLKALTYRPTGGMVAAVTMGLPEALGGERNWDYRYCWLRDTSFTLLVLVRAGFTEEAVAWRLWLLRAVAGTPDQVQVMYGLGGERQLQEWEATWLRGYEDSKPVRIGNAAATQFQLDVFGEVALALNRMPNAEDDIRVPAIGLQAALIDHLCEVWDQPDEGIWETRGGRKHFVHSKVMAWVALDRAIKAYDRARAEKKVDGNILSGDVDRWRKNRQMLHDEICEKGFNKELNSLPKAMVPGPSMLHACASA